MRVAQLIEILKNYDPSTKVLVNAPEGDWDILKSVKLTRVTKVNYQTDQTGKYKRTQPADIKNTQVGLVLSRS